VPEYPIKSRPGIQTYEHIKNKYKDIIKEDFNNTKTHNDFIRINKDTIMYSDIEHDKNVENLLKSNLRPEVYNNLTVA
jgi:hypothetical protein